MFKNSIPPMPAAPARAPLDENAPDGYEESLDDWVNGGAKQAVEWFCENMEAIREALTVDMKKVELPIDETHQVLQALVGPPHHIRELQAIRNPKLEKLTGEKTPITILTDAYNDYILETETVNHNEV